MNPYCIYVASYELSKFPTQRGGNQFDVTMHAVRTLNATNAADAMKEAKALGYIAPMVAPAVH